MESGFAATAFFAKTYREGLALATDARDYFGGVGVAESRRLPPEHASDYAAEAGRLSVRIMAIMAWLLTQRAVHAGEISQDAARDPANRLDAGSGRMASARDLPDGLRNLAERSEKLYTRVARLDEMMARDEGARGGPVKGQAPHSVS